MAERSVRFAVRTGRPDDPVSPYVRLGDPEPNLRDMLDGDELVVPEPCIDVLYDYPLSRALLVTHRSAGGFTRRGLARAVSEQYRRIYREEDATSGEPERLIPGMLNRRRTHGTHGVWGHVLGDLDLSAVTYDPGARVWRLSVES